MKRIDSANRAVNLFGTGKDGFQAAQPGIHLATELTPAWFNGVQEAIVRTIEAAGIALSEADYDQFTNAVIALIATRINAVVNAAPGTLDTLKELADALGDDPNFAATMAAQLATINAAIGTKLDKFPSGTRMLFQQTASPTGWTKVTTHNDKLLRVVSGTANSGGTVAFSSAFVNGSVGNTTLTINQIPSHTHTVPVPTQTETGAGFVASGGPSVVEATPVLTSDATGGGQPHTHALNLDVTYVDIIIASKD